MLPTLISKSMEQLPRDFILETDLRIAREYGHCLGNSGWFCIMNSQAEKYVTKTSPHCTTRPPVGFSRLHSIWSYFWKIKAWYHIWNVTGPSFAWIFFFFAPSKWSPCLVVLMSPSTFIFIILYCFKSFQNVFNAIYLRKNSSEFISNPYGMSLASAAKFQST